MKKAVSLVLFLLLVPILAACATTIPERQAALGAGVGAMIGAGTGALIGVITGDPVKGAILGGMSGAAAGTLYGYQRGLTIEQQQAQAAAAQAAAQAAAIGTLSCTRQERWSGGKLVVDELNCTSATTRAGFRGDPVPPGAPPPAILYKPASKEIDPYAVAPR